MHTHLYSLDAQLDFLGLKDRNALQTAWVSALGLKEKTALNLNDFVFDEAQVDYNFTSAELEGRLTPMAAVTGYNSEPATVGKSTKIKLSEGTIPRARIKIDRDEADYRHLLKLEQDVRAKAALRGEAPYDSLYAFYAENLFDSLGQFVEGHSGLINNMIGKVLSTRAYEATEVNNPQGGIRGTLFEAPVPTKNIQSLKWWSYDGDGNPVYVEDATPIKDLWKQARAIREDYYENIKVRVDRNTFYEFIAHPDVTANIGYALNGNLRNAPDNDANARATGEYAIYHEDEATLVNVVRRIIGVDAIQLENTVCAVSKWDKSSKDFVQTKVKAFEAGVFVFSPTGVIGRIKNVIPVRPDSSAVYSYIFDGRGIVEYRYDAQHKVQTWVSELTVLPVPDAPSKLFYLNVVG